MVVKWFVFIVLYMGMWFNEIGFMMVWDVRELEGIYYFDLLLFDGKMDNVLRIVFIYSKFIVMGLLDYVED